MLDATDAVNDLRSGWITETITTDVTNGGTVHYDAT
jgi:hypothetical protein